MNKIEKLSKKAWAYALKKCPESESLIAEETLNRFVIFETKFAELIVEETLKLVEKRAYLYGDELRLSSDLRWTSDLDDEWSELPLP